MRVDLVPFPVTLVLVQSREEYEAATQGQNDAPDWSEGDCCYGTTQAFGDGSRCLVVVQLRKEVHNSTLELVQTCAHEAVHVWQRARESINECDPGDEVEASFIDGITRWLLVSAGVLSET